MSDYIYALPHLNALLNATSGILLVTGYAFIRRKRVLAHRNCQIAALTTSALFLVSYTIYHYYHGSTRFPDIPVVRSIYLVILFTHLVLAVVILPLVFLTVYRAARGRFLQHRGIARWTFPLWLYVSVTGVIVYLMLYQFFPARG